MLEFTLVCGSKVAFFASDVCRICEVKPTKGNKCRSTVKLSYDDIALDLIEDYAVVKAAIDGANGA